MAARKVGRSSVRNEPVKSAIRALEILEYFDDVRCPQSIGEIARALSYPHSSATALLRSLRGAGYLQFNARQRTYFPTDRVPFLGSWLNPPLFEQAALPRMMKEIRRRTGQLVVVAALNGDMAQYIHVLNEPSAIDLRIRIGQKRPLAATGVGLVLLSAMADDDIRAIFHRINADRTRKAEHAAVRTVLPTVNQIRSQGYSFTRNRLFKGVGMLSLAIPTWRASQPLAVGVGGRCQLLEKREAEIVRIMRDAMVSFLDVPDTPPEPRIARAKRTAAAA